MFPLWKKLSVSDYGLTVTLGLACLVLPVQICEKIEQGDDWD
jgi:hypothetical protein